MFHVHSCFQLIDSAITIERLIDRAVQSKLRYAALCDANLYGAQKLFSSAHRKGILPIIGRECRTSEGLVSCFARNRLGYNLLVRYHNNLVSLASLFEADEVLKVFQYPIDVETLSRYPNTYYGFTSIQRGVHDDRAVFFLPTRGFEALDEEVCHALSFLRKKTQPLDEDYIQFSNQEGLVHRYPEYREEIERLFSLETYFSDYTLNVKVTIPLAPKVSQAVASGQNDEAAYLLELLEEPLLRIPEPRRETYRQRVYEEWSVIRDKNFTRYLLLALDFKDCCQVADAWMGPGRGSAVASLIVHLLGLTQPDPIENGLLFERFLNPDRTEPPDIDIDIEDTRRPAVLEEIIQRYGRHRVAQIVTFGAFGTKNAVREIEKIPELRVLLERSGHRTEIIERIGTLPRHTSIHAAGIVLSEEELGALIPLTITEEGTITQYDMNDLAEIGIVKFDLLGLTALSFLREAGIELQEVDPNDPSLYGSVRPDNLCGIFQLDTVTGRKIVERFEPKDFSDLRILISLNRPGPAKSGILEQIVLNREKEPDNLNLIPQVKEVLAETYGIPIFQEQIMTIATRLGGLLPAEADGLRRALTKKRPELLERYEESFYSGAAERGIDRKTAETYFSEMQKFAGYAFNKAHATAYATITLWMLYLKEHYPLRFYRGLFNRHHASAEKLFQILNECGRRGLTLEPPDLEKSDVETQVEGEGLRLGFQLFKGVNPAFFNSVIQERQTLRYPNAEELFLGLSTGLLDDQTAYRLYRGGLVVFSNGPVSYEGLIALRDRVKNEMQALQRTLFGHREKMGRGPAGTQRVEETPSALTPVELLNGQLAAYGVLLDFRGVFGLNFSPFYPLSGIHLVLVTETLPGEELVKGSDGLRTFLIRRRKDPVNIGDYRIVRGERETETIGAWDPSAAVLRFDGEAFFRLETQLRSSLSSLKTAGVVKIMIELRDKTMEVRL